MTVNSVWERITYTVTFTGPDGSELYSETVNHGDSLIVDESIFDVLSYTWIGYDGYYDLNNVTSDMTVNSIWNKTGNIVTFVGPNGETVAMQSVENGQDAVIPTDALNSVPGYFWGGVDIDTTNITNDVIVTSTWTETEKWKITQSVDINSAAGVSGAVTSTTSYTYTDMSADNGKKMVMTYYVAHSNIDASSTRLTVGFGYSHAKYVPRWYSGTHTASIVLDGTTGEAILKTNGYSADSDVTTETAGVGANILLTKGTFVKAEMARDFTDDGVDTGYIAVYYKTTDMSDFALFAKVSDLGYSFKNTNTSTLFYPAMFLTSNEGSLIDAEIRNLRWAICDSNYNVTSSSTTPVTDGSQGNNQTLVTNVNDIDDTYTVTFIGPDGGVLHSETVDYGTNYVVDESIFDVVGYDWQGFDGAYDFSYVIFDMEVYSTWLQDVHTITFIGPDGSTIHSETILEGESLVVDESIFAIDGYTWQGYDGSYDFTYVTSDMNVYSTWAVDAMTVTFIGPDGSTIHSETVDYGTSLVVDESIFEIDGYTWQGYDGEYDFTCVTADMTVYSTWLPISQGETYAVTYMVDGETYGTDVATAQNGYKLTSLPVVDDIYSDETIPYVFSGWYRDSAYTVPVSLNTVYSNDTVIYGEYKDAFLYDVLSDGIVIRGVIDELKGKIELTIPAQIDGVSVVEIGDEAFRESVLASIEIPSSVAKIGDSAFRDSADLNFVNIYGTGLQTVGNSAFRGCELLNSTTSITLPSSVQSVGELAFYGVNHPVYTNLYMLNYQDSQYYTSKYVWEFLGEDVMPIGSYGMFDAKGDTGVADPTYGVGLDTAIADMINAGINLAEFNSYNAVQDYDPNTQYSISHYMQLFEDYGGVVLYKDGAMKAYTYEEYEGYADGYQGVTGHYTPTASPTLNAYINLLDAKYASFGGVNASDEPGWVDWVDEYEEAYTFTKTDGTERTVAKGRMDDGHQKWQEVLPNKLMFVNLLQTYAPKWSLPNGFYGFDDAGQLDGVPSFTGRWAPLEGELDYEYYYRTYVESVKPEVFSYDYYPLKDGGTNLLNAHFEQLNYANYYSGEYYKQYHGTDTGIPFWAFIQLSGWDGFRPYVGANLSEVNWQINTALAYGAKGYNYYRYYSGEPGAAVDTYGRKQDNYTVVQTANAYAQAMAKWLLNAEVDHLYQYGANPNSYDYDTSQNTTAETTPTRMLTPKDTSMNWRFVRSNGVNNIVSKMKYYANNNDYRSGVAGDVRELYFACNNSITESGYITLNFSERVTGSYIYKGVEYNFSGTALTVNVDAGGAFAVLLDK